MIPTIIFFLLRRYKRQNPAKAERIELFVAKATKSILLIVLCNAIAGFALSQEKNLNYDIKRNGNSVGNIRFSQNSSGNRTILKMETEVKTRFIFTFIAKSREETIYENGIMTWSSFYRKMNGNVKADKKTKASGSGYTIFNGAKTEILNNYPIRYNMLSIYTVEPVNIGKVYSDNFQQFLDIQKLALHHYKIKFPDDNYCEYFYNNGICSKVQIHHSLYSATIELKSN
jgi:hypothetical protein